MTGRFSTVVVVLLIAAGCGGSGGSASRGFGAGSSGTDGARPTKGFGVQASQEAHSSATLSAQLAADAAVEEGIQLVFNRKTDKGPKGPAGPTNKSSWIKATVVDISRDLAYITVKPVGTPRRSPRIGEPAAVFFQWPVLSEIAQAGDVHEDALARGEVESVTNDSQYQVRINDFHSGAKISEGSAVIIGWY